MIPRDPTALQNPPLQHDPTWPYEDVEAWEILPSDPTWECATGFCSCHPATEAHEDSEKFSILLCDEHAVAMPGARCRVLADGVLVNRDNPHADARGWLTTTFRRLPEQVLVEWAPATTPLLPHLPFRKLFFVDLSPHERDEAAHRRLHNLGYSAEPTLEGNIRAFQEAYHHKKTGKLDDVEKELVAFHDRGQIPPRALSSPQAAPSAPSSTSAFSLVGAQSGPASAPLAGAGNPPTPQAGTLSKPTQAPPAPTPRYTRKILEAVDLLAKGPIGFGRAEETDMFPKDAWEVGDDLVAHAPSKLLVKMLSGKIPSEALALWVDLKEMKNWTVDCSQFCQLVLLYAHWKTLGDGAFDARIGKQFRFRIHDSTGIRSRIVFKRKAPGAPMRRLHDGTLVSQTVEELLDLAPVGSRVEWTNLDSRAKNTAFENENTIKLEKDLFAAHGFMATHGKNKFPRAELELELAKISEPNATPAFVQQNVFLSQIELFNTPS